FEGLVRVQPDDVAIQDAWAGALESQSDNYYESGSMQDALAADQNALRLREALARSGSPNDRYQLAMCQNHMGMVYSRGLGRTTDGEALINRAMDLCQDLARESPSSPTYVVGQADILQNLSRSKTIEGDFAISVAILTRELSLRERLAREDPGSI